jgi:DNA-binding GntR family transcriptional regulator
MEKPKLVSAKNQIAEILTREIVRGKLRVRENLYERDLAERLGVSRTPVREALFQLATIGLVENKNRIGWKVAIPKAADIKDVFQLRLILESAGIDSLFRLEHALQRADIARMFDKFTQGNFASELKEYLRVDARFHRSIIAATENKRIETVYRNVSLWIEWARCIISYEGAPPESLREHQQICRHLSHHDRAEAAKEALARHIRRVEASIIKMIETLVE